MKVLNKYFYRIIIIPAFIAALLFSSCSAPSEVVVTSTDQALNTAQTDFRLAVQKVLPSIVKVEVTYGTSGSPSDPQAASGAGTGWIIRQDGVIVTNHHIIDGAETISVVLVGGKWVAVASTKSAPEKDLSVLKIDAGNLPAVTVGDASLLRIGQPVAAIGNALDLGIRTSVGVVSQTGISGTYTDVALISLIETDAALNPGNSGGVLINMNGEVIGITNARLEDPYDDVEGFGYAINITEAMPYIDELINGLS